MSIIMVEQLENNEVITTTARFSKSFTVSDVRLGLYKKGSPDGDLEIKFKVGGNLIGIGLLLEEEIGSINGNYWHGVVGIPLSDVFRINVSDEYLEVTIEIRMINHTDDNENYIALKRRDNNYINRYGSVVDLGNEEDDLWLNPFELEIYGY